MTLDLLITTRTGDVVRRLVAGRADHRRRRARVARPPAAAPRPLPARRTRRGRERPLRGERAHGRAARARAPPAARPDGERPPRRLRLGGAARRRRGRRRRRQPRPCLRLPRAALVHHRQRRQGDAAGRVPAPARHGRPGDARDTHAHDHRLGQRRGRRGLQERRPRGPRAVRGPRRHALVPRERRVDPLPRRRRGHGALLPRHGAVRPESAPPLRQRPAGRRRLVPALGHPRWPRRRSATASTSSRAGSAPGSWPTRPPASSAAGSESASPSSPTTTRRPPTARRRWPVSRRGSSGAEAPAQAAIPRRPFRSSGRERTSFGDPRPSSKSRTLASVVRAICSSASRVKKP